MLAEEALFEGAPCAHVVAYYNRMRARHIAERNRRAADAWRRHRSEALPIGVIIRPIMDRIASSFGA